ncbi:MAG: FKBP-type peptidyl-prolyl cis-trans isomerase [Actinomycetota bacterium]|nr:FKBP-type peptidyl-prolyl cis-trans isomerase [Actinomycetota bacterium]
MRRSRAIAFTLLLASAAPAAGAALGATPAQASAARSGALPKVSGGYGTTPTITFPKGAKPPSKLEVSVLHEGTGPLTRKGDLLVANYVGQIWGGKVFDSSFTRHQLSGFAIGVGQVIKGWDMSLVGVHAGSRLLIVIPPVDGYGTAGLAQAGITGKDTLVFVVDVVASYSHATEITGHSASLRRTVGGVTVQGSLGSPPKISVAKGARTPSSPKTTVIVRGHGAKVTPGLVVVQYEVTNWSGVLQDSTWKNGTPYGINVDLASNPTIFDALKGVPLGSRVLVDIPASTSGGPYAFVADLVSEPHDPQR